MHLLVFPKGLNLCFPSCIENELPNRVSHIVPIGFLILVPFLFVVHAILVVAVSPRRGPRYCQSLVFRITAACSCVRPFFVFFPVATTALGMGWTAGHSALFCFLLWLFFNSGCVFLDKAVSQLTREFESSLDQWCHFLDGCRVDGISSAQTKNAKKNDTLSQTELNLFKLWDPTSVGGRVVFHSQIEASIGDKVKDGVILVIVIMLLLSYIVGIV